MRRNEVTLDPRTQKELCERLDELAASFTPEWHFTREDPDVGSTLALIFAQQTAENIHRLNRLPEKYHTEFTNLMGISLQPPHPASGIAAVRMLRGTTPGVMLPAGSRLLADPPSGEAIHFETTEDVYLTSARITDLLSVSGTKGKIVPLLGGPAYVGLYPGDKAPDESEEEAAAEEEPSAGNFALFDFSERGVERNALLLYHRSLFHTEPDAVLLLHLKGRDGTSPASLLSDARRWRWSYYDGTSLVPITDVRAEGEVLALRRPTPSQSLTLDGEETHLLCLEALEPVCEAVELEDLRIASRAGTVRPQVILHDGEELESESCMPFGETVSLFDECYIGDDRVFSQQGATIRLRFALTTKQKLVSLTFLQEVDELKVIKRKPRAVQYEIAESAPQRVSLEYYNGVGWRKLNCQQDCSTLFDGTHTGEQTLTFQCPEDWRSYSVGGYEGRCLRFRVTQADNCFLIPCQYTMPCLGQVSLSYDYEGQWKQPQRLRTVVGTRVEDQTRALLTGGVVTAFRPLPYPPAALYLGFDRPFGGGPISIFFDVEENVHFRTEPITVEYATRDGFKPLKVMDGTRDFSAAGTMLFMPPSDSAPLEVEGMRRWWLRLCAPQAAVEGYHPMIRSVLLNALNIRNQQTLEERDYYVDVAQPNMTFPLGVDNILRADVFVSELGQLSRQQMQELEEREPQNVRIERDFLGEVTGYYVRWEEVSSFDSSKPTDRHYMIDRMNHTIVFGDGIHVRIPRARQGVAFTVRCIRCDGVGGNLPANAISRLYGNTMYIESVTNPVATYAGSDMESVESARRRGADLLSNRGRLISQADFKRAVYAFSDSVEKVKCLAGIDLSGREDPTLITIAVMTHDYDRGAYAYNNIRQPLRKHLLSCCDATVSSDCLVLSEPVYVEVSVSVWAKVDADARPFDVQNLILDSIRSFLEPLKRNGSTGWDIGVLPRENQINMLMQSLRFQGHIERIITTARYVDRFGTHETELDRLTGQPFAIAVSGKHQVYIQYQ